MKEHWLRSSITFTLIGLIVLALFYGSFFRIWNHQIMGKGEDGAKNFYTLLYHISHDKNPVWFDGMNYPHGEHVLYTDNQPLVANTLKVLNMMLPIDSNLHWLLPMLILLSYLLGGWCLWRLVLRTDIPPWFALFAAVGVMLLSPQLSRMGGHYSLAYGCVIPVVFFLLQRAREKPDWLRWSLLFLWVFSVAFLHPYFLAMCSMFLLCFFVTELIVNRQLRDFRQWGKIFIVAIGPVVLLQLVMWLTDPILDRPTDPYGFVHYRATWSSIFLPVEYAYYRQLSSIGQPGAEGAFYTGLFALASALWMVVRFFRSRKTDESRNPTSFWNLFLWASVPLLLLATAFPFHIWKLDQLLHYLGPLKQFRGVGRFSFVFFYAVNLFAVIQVGRWINHKSPSWNWTIGGAALLVLFAEAYGLRNRVTAATQSGTDVFSKIKDNPALTELSASGYQAILPLPFFHIGSENLRTPNVEAIREHAFALSQETGLPLLATQMSRTSLSQSLQAFQFVNEQFVYPEIISPANGFQKGPILLCVAQNQMIPPSQADLINHATPIGHHEGYDLFALELAAFNQIRKRNEQMLNDTSGMAQMAKGIYYSDSTRKSFYWNPFEDRSDPGYGSSNGVLADRSNWNALIPDDYGFEPQRDYELSFWIHASQQSACNTQIWLWERNGDQEVRFELSEVSDHITAVDGEWALIAVPLSVEAAGGTLEVNLHRSGRSKNINYDELLIRPTDETLIARKNGRWGINNRYFASE